IHVDSEVFATITPAGPYCENENISVNLTAISSGGTWTGNGITDQTNGVFNPSVATAGDHIITYSVANGACSDTDNIIIHIDADVDAGITEVGPFCDNELPFLLNAVDYGGIWSGNGVVDNISGLFAPSEAGEGDHTISYSIVNGMCSDSDEIIIHIDISPDASIIPVDPICETVGEITLQSINSGGTWSGTAVSGNIFNPQIAGQGNHDISYTLYNGVCYDTKHITIHVDTMPYANILPIDSFCEDYEFAYLQATTSGGAWSGTGITNAELGQFSPLFSGPGEHLITYNITNGLCSNSDSYTIHVNNYLDATINPIVNICQISDPITLSAVTPGGIWAGQGIIDPINGILDPREVIHGNNTMTYTVANGACVSTDIHIYQVDEQISAAILSPSDIICLDAPPFQLSSLNPGGIWSGNGIGNNITGTFIPNQAGVGIHTISYHIENGSCNDSQEISIEVIEVPDATILTSGTYCENSSPISLESASLGGTWSGPGVVGNSFDPSIAGAGEHIITYSISIGSCSNSSSTVLYVDEFLEANILNDINLFCENSAAIVLNAENSGGTWSGNGVNNNYFNPNIAGEGTHTITYSIVNGLCSDSQSIDFIIDSYPDVNIESNISICGNEAEFELEATPSGGVWSGVGVVGNSFNPSISGVGNFAINYIVENGACTSNNTLNITVHPIPNAVISNNQVSNCENSPSFVLVASPPGGTFSGNGIDGVMFNPSLAGIGDHEIQYNVTNSFGCSDSATVVITVNSIPDITFTLSETEICYNAENIELIASPSGGSFSGNAVIGNQFSPILAGAGEHTITYNYTSNENCSNFAEQTFTVSEPIIINLTGQNLSCNSDNTGSIEFEITGGVPNYISYWNVMPWSTDSPMNTIENLAAGLYKITVIDSWNCSETDSIIITEPEILQVEILSYGNPLCHNDSNGFADASVSGGTSPYFYSWDNEYNSNSSSIDNLAAGTYNITVTDNNSCSASNFINLINHDPLIVSISSYSNVICGDENSGEISISLSGGVEPYTYLWNNNANTQNISNLPAGFYEVSVYDTNSCSATANISINNPSDLTIKVNSSDIVCTHNLGSASVVVETGEFPFTYQWSNGETNSNISNLQAGTYYITVKDANNCIATDFADIQILGNIDVAILQNLENNCFGDSNAELEAYSTNATEPVNYQWSNGANTKTISNLPAGNYELFILDAWGCSNTASKIVKDGIKIKLNANITAFGCYGESKGSISLQISGGQSPYDILWSNGENSEILHNLNAGNYYVTVTDANECMALGSYTVNNPASPLSLQIFKKDISCYGYTDGEISISAKGGSPEYSYLWKYNNHNFTGSSASNLSGGIYNITVVDSQNCDLDTLVVINEPKPIEYSFVSVNPSCIGNDDGYIEISIIGGKPPYNISWANQTAASEIITGLKQGAYMFTFTDNNGCKTEANLVELIDDDLDCLKIPNAFSPNGDGINDTWIIENIEDFPWATIHVFNRWGQLMFEGKGNSEHWDGTFNGKPVPTGSYLYTVDLHNGTKHCGIVTIIY
ncbi:MAG: gliding motility-associated C-terminal domain-containing protein, partial [Bacteroidales bacterium]|nr:gliding motility-associated C-terminal domain-containing protein [Bacteroidales bacterium]